MNKLSELLNIIFTQGEHSDRWKLNLRDWIKGLFLAVATPVLMAAIQSLEAGHLHIDTKLLGIVAASSLSAYLFKNGASKAEQKTGEQKSVDPPKN